MRRVVVVGGSRGVGEAIVRSLLAAGDQVAVVARTAPAEASQCFVRGDLAEPTSLSAAVGEVGRQLGGIDVLVVVSPSGPPTPLSGGEAVDVAWQQTIATGLTGPWRAVRAALPMMADGSRIVLVGAAAGRHGWARYGAFVASQHGLIGMMRALALELAPRRITVNVVAAGARAGRVGPGMVIPLGEPVAPHDVAGLVQFLTTASAITAQVMGVDGGITPHA